MVCISFPLKGHENILSKKEKNTLKFGHISFLYFNKFYLYLLLKINIVSEQKSDSLVGELVRKNNTKLENDHIYWPPSKDGLF